MRFLYVDDLILTQNIYNSVNIKNINIKRNFNKIIAVFAACVLGGVNAPRDLEQQENAFGELAGQLKGLHFVNNEYRSFDSKGQNMWVKCYDYSEEGSTVDSYPKEISRENVHELLKPDSLMSFTTDDPRSRKNSFCSYQRTPEAILRLMGIVHKTHDYTDSEIAKMDTEDARAELLRLIELCKCEDEHNPSRVLIYHCSRPIDPAFFPDPVRL